VLRVFDVSKPNPAYFPLVPTVIGLDLGKYADYSALASVTWTIPVSVPHDWKADYNVPTLHRWPLLTSYKDIGDEVIKFEKRISEATLPAHVTLPPLLVVDATGVGEAVVECLYEQLAAAKAKGKLCGVTITAGQAATRGRKEGRCNVAKMVLVSVLQVLLGNRRLHLADQEYASVLLRELETFQMKATDALNVTYESLRERDHDDLVLAVALACWGAETLCNPPAERRDRAGGSQHTRYITPSGMYSRWSR
jgi:hypothetical protein